jgi:small-conductance mechanosensitive channel
VGPERDELQLPLQLIKGLDRAGMGLGRSFREMRRDGILIGALVFVSAFLWIVSQQYPGAYLDKAFKTFLSFALVYAFFRYAVDEAASRRVKDSKTKYQLRKIGWILSLVVSVVVFLLIWLELENRQALAVSYGLLAAGVAIALQDLFRNFVGGILILTTGVYRVGDRVEIQSNHGDVIDVGLLYTTLLEIREWVGGDQATGRLKIMPNGAVLANTVSNYTKDHSFIWDEITIPITYESDWKEAGRVILDIARRETEPMFHDAEREISKIEKKYYLPRRSIEPAVYATVTSNWIELSLRYITGARDRRLVRSRLTNSILEEIEKSPGIDVASESYDITLKGDQHRS